MLTRVHCVTLISDVVFNFWLGENSQWHIFSLRVNPVFVIGRGHGYTLDLLKHTHLVVLRRHNQPALRRPQLSRVNSAMWSVLQATLATSHRVLNPEQRTRIAHRALKVWLTVCFMPLIILHNHSVYHSPSWFYAYLNQYLHIWMPVFCFCSLR